MEQELQQQLLEFEKSRQQLASVSAQKQQLQLQGQAIQQAIEELGKTKEKKVFKAVGNILFPSETSKAKEELEDKKESVDLRLKAVQKQEESLVNRLNKLKSQLEKAQQEEPEQVTENDSNQKS